MSTLWDFYYSLYLDVDRPHAPLLIGRTSSTQADPVTWVQSDQFPLRLFFRRRGAIQAPSASISLPAELSITLGARQTQAKAPAGPLLLLENDWTEGTSDGDAYYETTLNLHTQELDDLVEAQGRVTLQVDIEIGTRLTYVIPVTIIPEAYKGEADPPPTLNPLSAKIVDGTLQIYNADTETWVTLTIVGEHNQIQIDEVTP